jgi:hypothetical protein
MSAPVVGITTQDGRLAVTFTRDGKLEGWAYFDELSYEARDTFLAALENQKKNNRGKIDLGKIAQQLSENDPFIRTRCRALARVAIADQLGLEAECLRSGTDESPHLVLKVPETIPQEKRIEHWLTVYFVGVEAEKQIYGSYTGDGNGEILELARQFHLDNGHLLQASPRATGQPKRYGFEGVDVDKVAEELRASAPSVQAWAQQDKEAALDKPYHLFFFSAVDRNGRARFFDVMKHEDGFSIAETATLAPRLAECVETSYGTPGGHGTHHLHRNYGKYPMAIARQAMDHFASLNGLTQVAQIAETHTLREAGPTWKLVFESLGCPPTTASPKPVSDSRTARDSRVEAGEDREAKNRPTTLISLETIDALLKGANIVTRREDSALSFKGFIGETRIEITPSGFRTTDGLEVSDIIRIESLLEQMPVTWNNGLLCAVNTSASNGALAVDSDGRLQIRSRISLFSGEPREVRDVYTGIIFFGAIIHTNAVQASIVDAWHLPIAKAKPLADSELDGVWAPAAFERTLSMMRNAGVFANGDVSGLTAELPWDPGAFSAVETLLGKRRKRTSLLRIERTEHPNLGKGLFCRLDLPLNLSDAEAFKLAIELNRMEFGAADWPPFLGAWTSKPGSGHPTFVSFWPNCFAKVISLELISTWHAARAKRVPEWMRSNSRIR